ncbi:MAG: hypothetical protein AAGE52_14420 [Myxococcota bacterium]
MKRVAKVLALVFAGSCSAGSSDTAIRLQVSYDDSWGLTSLRVAARDAEVVVDAAHELLVLVPDAWAEEDLLLEVTGFRGDERYAAGRTTTVPRLGEEVSAEVVLARLPCGAWCTEGTTTCGVDAVLTCIVGEDGCADWGPPTPCDSTTPFCSLGVCTRDCVDECAEGDQRCAGATGIEICGEADSDSCRDWLPVMACGEGTVCSAGECRPECQDECAEGEIRCQDGGRSRCGDRNVDGCLEWGPTEQCGSGDTCSMGACIPVSECTDECTESACNLDGTFAECGDFDFDPCRELSPGRSCDALDPCTVGRCGPEGCETAPLICNMPPESECLGTSVLRVFDPAGTCNGGSCDYMFRDVDCPGCPACDACAGVVCNSPPNECFSVAGTCADGVCTYPLREGASCDDDDGCTTGDSCEAGVCAGEPVVCNMPPAQECIDGDTLRRYLSPGTCTADACEYMELDTSCAMGCAMGKCTLDCTPMWELTTADSRGATVWFTSIAIDDENGVHISYYDLDSRILRYAYRAPGATTFTTQAVDSLGQTGLLTSIALDSLGGVHISYHNNSSGALMYAYKERDDLLFTTMMIDGAGDTGEYTSLAIDASNGSHISYYDRTRGNLRYAYRPDLTSAFTLQTVDASRDVGQESSLALDAGGLVHIVYYDIDNRDLKYAEQDVGGSFTVSTLDSMGDTGRYPAVDVDSLGGVHISYHDAEVNTLRYAYRAPSGTFVLSTIDGATPTGFDTSIVVDESDGIHIAYYDAMNDDLRYAFRALGGSFETQLVDATGNTGRETGIALDRLGGVHISYHELSTGNLRHAYNGCPE